MSNIYCFYLLRFKDLMLFFATHDFKLNIFAFVLLIRQNKTFQDVSLM